MRRVLFCTTLLALLAPGSAVAQGINTDVALPVARGEGIWRSQLRYLRASDDPAGLGRELDSLVAPQTLVYGITPRLTAFATLPILAHRRFDPCEPNCVLFCWLSPVERTPRWPMCLSWTFFTWLSPV